MEAKTKTDFNVREEMIFLLKLNVDAPHDVIFAFSLYIKRSMNLEKVNLRNFCAELDRSSQNGESMLKRLDYYAQHIYAEIKSRLSEEYDYSIGNYCGVKYFLDKLTTAYRLYILSD